MKNILVFDVQKLDASEVEYYKKLFNYLHSNSFDNIFYTKHIINGNKATKGKLSLCKLPKGKMFTKKCHGINQTAIEFFKSNNISSLELCGVNDKGSMMCTANILENNNIEIKVLPDLIVCYDEAPVQDVNQGVCHGFYVGEMIASGHKSFGLWTMLTFAVIEWLVKGDFSTQDLQFTMRYYHKLYNKNGSDYNDSLAQWLINGCKTFHVDDGWGGVVISTIIGLWGKSFEQIEAMVNKCLTVAFNSDISKRCAVAVCNAIWLVRTNLHKRIVFQKMRQKYPDINFSDNLAQCKQDFVANQSPINFVRLVLSAFVNSNSFASTLDNLQDVLIAKSALLSVAGALAEAYYRQIPKDVLAKSTQLLPEKFVNLLLDFTSQISQN